MTEETNPGIVWEDPPKIKHGHRHVWPERLAPLRERPGVWARISEHPNTGSATSMAGNLRRGALAGYDPSEFQFRSSTPKDGPYYVYGRYMPKEGN